MEKDDSSPNSIATRILGEWQLLGLCVPGVDFCLELEVRDRLGSDEDEPLSLGGEPQRLTELWRTPEVKS